MGTAMCVCVCRAGAPDRLQQCAKLLIDSLVTVCASKWRAWAALLVCICLSQKKMAELGLLLQRVHKAFKGRSATHAHAQTLASVGTVCVKHTELQTESDTRRSKRDADRFNPLSIA
jgi:hypothetical protein